jgi:hypothetical protein
LGGSRSSDRFSASGTTRAKTPTANGSDTKTALTGVSYLQQDRWRQAETTLIAGVLASRTTSGYTKLFAGNVIAMQMLFAYRAHFERGQGHYHWPVRI